MSKFVFPNDFDVNFKDDLIKALDAVDLTATNAHQRIIDLIQGSEQPSEVVDARLGEATLRDKIESVDTSKLSVNLEKYNPDGTGVNNNLTAFTQAINYSKSIENVTNLPVPIKMASGTYRIVKTADLEIPSLICDGFATIIVEDPYSFVVSSNFTLSNVKILSKNIYSKTSNTFKPIFKANTDVENITFDNVVFDSELSALDGTVRASQCANFKAVKNFRLNNVTVEGYRHGFTLDGLSENIKGNMLHFENVELPIYVRGSSPQVQNENYAKNIQFSNVSHINTQSQRQNYYVLQGADTFLLEKCDTITITNVISENPVERSCYSSCCRNVVYHGWDLKNALGIKFVGGSNTAVPIEIIASNCKISNVHSIFDDTTLTQQGYIAEFYWAKDWSVKGCTLNGNSIASVVVSTRHYIENGVVEDCYGENLKRGLFEYSYVGTIDGTILEGNYTSGVKNITIRNNAIKNSNTLDYDVIKLSDSTPPTAGTYRYEDIKIINNTIINPVDDFGISLSNNYCKGLINIDSVQNLYIEGNTIIGYKRTDVNGNTITLPIQVGSNSKNVIIKHEETVRSYDTKYIWGTLYLSSDSKIAINTIHRNFSFQDTAIVTMKHDTTNLRTTKDISQNFRISGKTSLSNTTDFGLALIGFPVTGYTLPSLFGHIDIITSGGDIGGYTITSGGVVALKSGSSALFVTSSTAGKFALIKETLRYNMRYNNAPSVSFIIEYSINAA